MDSSPEPELLGAFTSHGPCRELYTPTGPFGTCRMSSAARAPAANPPLFVERMRAAVSSAAGATTLLQPGVPAGSAEVVALESPAEIPGDDSGQRETQRAEPALPRAGANPPTNRTARGACGGREGNHSPFFSITVAIAPAAMRGSPDSSGRPRSDSVHVRAGGRWSGSGSASGVGAVPSSSGGTGEPRAAPISQRY